MRQQTFDTLQQITDVNDVINRTIKDIETQREIYGSGATSEARNRAGELIVARFAELKALRATVAAFWAAHDALMVFQLDQYRAHLAEAEALANAVEFTAIA